MFTSRENYSDDPEEAQAQILHHIGIELENIRDAIQRNGDD